MEKLRLHLIIEGRVQGVWFRDSTRREATALGVRGWARNRPEGTVEIIAEGEETAVRKLAAWCRQGPPQARVSRVHETAEPWQGEFEAFTVVF